MRLIHHEGAAMSFWFHRKDKQGRMQMYSVSVPTLAFVAIIGFALAFLLPLLQWLRMVIWGGAG